MDPFMQVERTLHVDALYHALDVVRPKDFYFPGESHDFWELVFIDSGSALVTAENRCFDVSSGSQADGEADVPGQHVLPRP